MKIKFQCLVLIGAVSLSACQQEDHRSYEPNADDILSAMSKREGSVIQVEKNKCTRINPFEGQDGNSFQFDSYQCDIKVKRYSQELNQYFTQDQQVSVRLSSVVDWDWQVD